MCAFSFRLCGASFGPFGRLVYFNNFPKLSQLNLANLPRTFAALRAQRKSDGLGDPGGGHDIPGSFGEMAVSDNGMHFIVWSIRSFPSLSFMVLLALVIIINKSKHC